MSSDHTHQKPILVILPGWGGTRQTWSDFIAAAGEYFNVECIELPCFGNEPCPVEVWGVEDYSVFIQSKITRLRSEELRRGEENLKYKMVILGHSFGGQVAVQLVGTNPGICDTLVLSGPAIFRKKISLKRLVFWPIAKLGKLIFSIPGLKKLEKIAQRILYKAVDSPDYSDTSGIKRQIFQKITTEDVSKYLPNISVPTLVIAGKNDTYVSWQNSKKAADLLPHSEFVLIPDGKHGLHHTHLQKSIDLIRTFVQQPQ